MFNNNQFFTTVTAVDSCGGKSFFSATGKTSQESIDQAIQNYTKGKMDNDDQILAIRTYDDINAVSLKSIRQ